MSTGVTFVRAEEFSDLRTYDAPDVLRHVMGFGDTPEKALTGSDAEDARRRVHPGGQDVRRHSMGFNADPRIRATQEIAVATAPIDSPHGCDPAGAGRRPQVPLGGPRRRRTRGPCDGELVHGRGEPRSRHGRSVPRASATRWRSRATRDFTVIVKGFQSETGEEGPREQRHRRDRSALRELGPRGVRRRTGHRHLPRPAADQREGRTAPELTFPSEQTQTTLNRPDSGSFASASAATGSRIALTTARSGHRRR